MRWTTLVSGVGLLLMGLLGHASAQSYQAIPVSTFTPIDPRNDSAFRLVQGTTSGAAPASPAPAGAAPMTAPPGAAPFDTASAGAGERGSGGLASAANPTMLGDLLSSGFGAVRRLPTVHGSPTRYARSPLAGRSGIKISENESPRPLDRGFVTFNYFNGVQSFERGQFNFYRGMVGFEKTFLDGDASVGLRLPFTQADNSAVSADGFGDLSLILKYAFYNDLETGDLLSGGVVVSTPTGTRPTLYDGTKITSVLLQPWLGGIANFDDLYVHGFTAVIVPTQNHDVTLYTLDVGVGYLLYQAGGDRLMTGIIPTLEAHANIPISSAGKQDLIYFPDSVFLTGGVHFRLGTGCYFTVGAAVPVTGPQLYDVEFMTQLNVRF